MLKIDPSISGQGHWRKGVGDLPGCYVGLLKTGQERNNPWIKEYTG